MNVILATTGMGIWVLRGIIALALVAFIGSLIHDFVKMEGPKKS